jgi:hypothetical protein
MAWVESAAGSTPLLQEISKEFLFPIPEAGTGFFVRLVTW